jgi:hypothetical protein
MTDPDFTDMTPEEFRAAETIGAPVRIVTSAAEYRAALRSPETEDPEDGHQFHFAVRCQGSSAVTGEPHTDDDWMGEAFRLTVRAWSLAAACRKAGELGLYQWAMPDDEDERRGYVLPRLAFRGEGSPHPDDVRIYRYSDQLGGWCVDSGGWAYIGELPAGAEETT